jgi:hypothetical protein
MIQKGKRNTMTQLTLQIEDETFRNVAALAASRGTNVEVLLGRVLNAMASEPWRKNQIGPLTQMVSGLSADDGLTDRELIERAILERHG